MADKLTIPQEKFAQAIIRGENQHNAYLIAYPNAKEWARSSIDVNASKLMANAKVKLRIEGMLSKHKAKAIMTRDELLRGLKKAFYMSLGIEAKRETVEEIIKTVEGEEIKVLSDRLIHEVDLRALAVISQQIAKLEGWDQNKLEIKSEEKVVIIDNISKKLPKPNK